MKSCASGSRRKQVFYVINFVCEQPRANISNEALNSYKDKNQSAQALLAMLGATCSVNLRPNQ